MRQRKGKTEDESEKEEHKTAEEPNTEGDKKKD